MPTSLWSQFEASDVLQPANKKPFRMNGHIHWTTHQVMVSYCLPWFNPLKTLFVACQLTSTLEPLSMPKLWHNHGDRMHCKRNFLELFETCNVCTLVCSLSLSDGPICIGSVEMFGVFMLQNGMSTKMKKMKFMFLCELCTSLIH